MRIFAILKKERADGEVKLHVKNTQLKHPFSTERED